MKSQNKSSPLVVFAWIKQQKAPEQAMLSIPQSGHELEVLMSFFCVCEVATSSRCAYDPQNAILNNTHNMTLTNAKRWSSRSNGLLCIEVDCLVKPLWGFSWPRKFQCNEIPKSHYRERSKKLGESHKKQADGLNLLEKVDDNVIYKNAAAPL